MKRASMLIVLLAVFVLAGCTTNEDNPTSGDQTSQASRTDKASDNPGNQPNGPGGFSNEVTVSEVDSEYEVAPGELAGWFGSGQEADILLSGIDFNNTGGPLLFNHPKSLVTDGTHLLLADGNNNRVLIWNSLPTANTEPDLVLGQPDFTSNNPGTGLDQMNWPVAVATDGQYVLVADTYNDRILIWNQFPTTNGQAADLVLDGRADSSVSFGQVSKTAFGWPWGLWTDGTKVAVSSTSGGYVLIWNQFPTQNNQPADLYLTAGGNMGTPRTITSDGQSLIVGDHNASNTSNQIGNFFWSTFPTADDQAYDFFRPDPYDANSAWMKGTFTDDGKLVMLGRSLHIWDSLPTSADDRPDLTVDGFDFRGGDGGDVAIGEGRVYICEYNGNRITAYNSMPTSSSQQPDFAIGTPDPGTNTLETNFIMTNTIPATDGQSLFVSSDFDRKLYVWANIPNQSGAHPDLVYSLPEATWDNALWGSSFVLAGRKTVYLWDQLPTNKQLPSQTFTDQIGSVALQDLMGVALDDTYFYLSDSQANKVYVWEGVPDENTDPSFSLDIGQPGRLSSDGEYLAVTVINEHSIYLYRIEDLAATSEPVKIGGQGKFNLPQNAIVSHGSLFIADTTFNRVLFWQNVADAFAGQAEDGYLGREWVQDAPPLIGKDSLFWPAGLAFDGSYLWVGEFKFSERLLRFSAR